jgi:hypothetical protein
MNEKLRKKLAFSALNKLFCKLYMKRAVILFLSLIIQLTLFSQGRTLYFRTDATTTNIISDLWNWSINVPNLTDPGSFPSSINSTDTLVFPSDVSFTSFLLGNQLNIATIRSLKDSIHIGSSTTGPAITMNATFKIFSNCSIRFSSSQLNFNSNVIIENNAALYIDGSFFDGVTNFMGNVTVEGYMYVCGTVSFSKDLTAPNGRINIPPNNYDAPSVSFVNTQYPSNITLNTDGNTSLGALLYFDKAGQDVRMNSDIIIG